MAILKLAALAAIAAAWVPHHSGIARSRIARSTSARSRIARSTGASARSRIARSTGASSRSAAVSASDAQQWIDFTTHQAKGEWHCARTTYDASGAAVGGDESLAIVVLKQNGDSCDHAMRVPTTEVASSGCDRCASTMEFRDIALGSYSEGSLGRFVADGRGCVVGPAALRSGGASVEVALADGDRRVAAICSYAPRWGESRRAPEALGLARIVVSREAAGGAFPEVDDDLYGETPPPEAWGDAGDVAVDAPGGISLRVPEKIAPGSDARVKLRWRGSGCDAAISALPHPPRLDSFTSD